MKRVISIAMAVIATASLNVNAGQFDKVVRKVSSETGVPAEVITKVCVHESQSFHKGKRQAWPWTLNIAGRGIWYKDRLSATVAAEMELSKGKRNIDVGMCQINWRWHGSHFRSVGELLDPLQNMTYAAKYLMKIKRGRTWEETIGAYHSPSNLARAKKYAKAVLRQ